MTKKLTNWYPASVKPVRVGVYETKFTEVETLFSKWADGEWKMNNLHKESAAKVTQRSYLAYSDTRMQWRGLASNPKGKK